MHGCALGDRLYSSDIGWAKGGIRAEAPTDVRVSLQDGWVTVSWQSPSVSLQGVKVYRSLAENWLNAKVVCSANPAMSSCSDETADVNGLYYYWCVQRGEDPELNSDPAGPVKYGEETRIIHVEDGTLDFGDVEVKESKQLHFFVQNLGNRDLFVSNIECPRGLFHGLDKRMGSTGSGRARILYPIQKWRA